jgi:hypothetical protein
MSTDRREFIRLVGAASVVAGTATAATPATAQMPGQFKSIKALAFDACQHVLDPTERR